MTGIDVSGRLIILDQLQTDLEAGGVAVPKGLTIAGPGRTELPDPMQPPGALLPCTNGSTLFTHDAQGNATDLPPEAVPIVQAYTPR